MSPQPAPSEGGFVRHVVTFGRILREAGLEVGPGRISDALTGLDCLDIRNRDANTFVAVEAIKYIGRAVCQGHLVVARRGE